MLEDDLKKLLGKKVRARVTHSFDGVLIDVVTKNKIKYAVFSQDPGSGNPKPNSGRRLVPVDSVSIEEI